MFVDIQMRMRVLLLLLGICLSSTLLYGQKPEASQTPTVNALHAAPTENAPAARAEVMVPESKLTDALTRWIEKLAQKKSPESFWDKALPALLTLIGTVVGGAITALVSLIGLRSTIRRDENREKETSKREEMLASLRAENEKNLSTLREDWEKTRAEAAAKREERLEELKASLEITRELLKSRQERLEKFHSPLRALFQESRGVTDRLSYHVYRLSRDKKWPSGNEPDPREYAYLTDVEVREDKKLNLHPPPDDKQDRRLRVRESERWRTFRTLDFMPWLKQNPECRALIDQIMEIGRKKTVIIQKYSGLAAADQNPSPVFGEYLAHYAVLKSIYDSPPAEPYAPGSQVGYYPRGLDQEVENGYDQARKAVGEFEVLAVNVISRVNHSLAGEPIQGASASQTQ
jgi:hypothetical protein